MNNTCIICNTIIPEGRQVCPTCTDVIEKYAPPGVKTKTIKKFIMRGAEQTDE